MILNGGTNPDTNATIIQSAQFDIITLAHSILIPNVSLSTEISAMVYGRMG